MIYLKNWDVLTSNIVLPREEKIEELKSLKESLLNVRSKEVSNFVISEAFKDKNEQMKGIFNLNQFICDDDMLSSLENACFNLDSYYVNYFLKKVSLDYYYFVFNVFDKIYFQEVDSYSVKDLDIAHKMNERFMIEDNFYELLSYSDEAFSNSRVLKLADSILNKSR